MADYRDWCHKCGKEISFGSHAPWCGKMEFAEWKREQDKTVFAQFQELELNILTVDTLYECGKCYSVVRDCLKHWKNAHTEGDLYG